MLGIFRKKGVIALIIVASILLLFILHIVINVNPIVEQVSEKEVKTLATIAVNKACAEVLNEYVTVDMVDYVMSDGSLQLITTNTALMNTVAHKAVDLSQDKISELGAQGVPIPLGSLSGITVFSGQGPNVYIKVFPIGSVDASFSSEFIAAGINQTRHKIMLNVSAEIRVVMPGVNNVVHTNTQILMCENVIIGKVPDAFFNMNNLSDLLNLVP